MESDNSTTNLGVSLPQPPTPTAGSAHSQESARSKTYPNPRSGALRLVALGLKPQQFSVHILF